jgi:hypothetical protein
MAVLAMVAAVSVFLHPSVNRCFAFFAPLVNEEQKNVQMGRRPEAPHAGPIAG